MATKADVFKIVTALSVLPNCPITKDNAAGVNEMFFLALQDIPQVYLQAAYIQYICSDKPFFPSNPGTLRNIAYDLEMIALGIPSPAEAWAAVIKGGEGHKVATVCETGHALREEYIKGQTRGALMAYDSHMDICKICTPPAGFVEEYGHPAINDAVIRMGGRDVIFTDNEVADRARFMDEYRTMVSKERMRAQLSPIVRELVERGDRPALSPQAGVSLLAGKLNSA